MFRVHRRLGKARYDSRKSKNESLGGLGGDVIAWRSSVGLWVFKGSFDKEQENSLIIKIQNGQTAAKFEVPGSGSVVTSTKRSLSIPGSYLE